MRWAKIAWFFVLPCLLASCTQKVVEDSWHRIEIPEIDLAFRYPLPLEVRDAGEEYFLVGSGVQLFATRLRYKEHSQGFGDWALPASVRDAVSQKKSCESLQSRVVSLPVNVQKTHFCDVVSGTGRTVVSLIGYGIPFESLDFLQSVLLILDSDSYSTLTYVTPFPEAERLLRIERSRFRETYPHLPDPVWPNRGFHFHAIDVRAVLQSQLEPLSMEVWSNRKILNEIAESILAVSESGATLAP